MPEQRRLAIARVSYEANSFNPLVAGRDRFESREWTAGEAARAFYGGTRSELGAAVDFLESHGDWDGQFLRCCAAPPGGPADSALVRGIRREIVDGLSEGPWDGVYLSLHGAMAAEHDLAPDLELISAARAAIGKTPLAVTFDLHANLEPATAAHADIVAGYKTYPHIDTYETAAKALGLLDRTVSGEIRPAVRVARLEALLPSFNMRTGSGPMAEVEAEARALEERLGLLDVTPFGGFAYGDVPHAGASVSVCADGDGALAERAAGELRDFFLARRAEFTVTLPDAGTALRQALEDRSGRPVAVLEPADNPMSGGIGDTPGLFRALLEAAAGAPAVFAFFWDPDLAARAHGLGVGAELDCRLGARLSADYGAPVEVSARVARLTDGRFVNRGPMERGLPVDLGPTAVLDVRGIQVIVTSACVSPNDPAYFELHGIGLDGLGLLCAKAKNHFRAAFSDNFAAIVDADTPGPAALDLGKLPYKRVPKSYLVPGAALGKAG